MMQLEEERRAHDLELARLQADSDKRDREITETLRDVAKITERFTTKWTYAAFAVALAALILVVLAYLFPDEGRHFGEWITRQSIASPSPYAVMSSLYRSGSAETSFVSVSRNR